MDTKNLKVLSKVESDVLAFVTEYKKQKDGNSPSYREIAKGTKNSRAKIEKIIIALEAKGYLEKDGSTPRSLRVVEQAGI